MVPDPNSPLSCGPFVDLVLEPDKSVFNQPWEAEAFAIVFALHQAGLITWGAWAATLADEIRRAQAGGDPDTGETYYSHWLAALERVVAERGIASVDTQAHYRDAWRRAAQRTPHGEAIELAKSDFATVGRWKEEGLGVRLRGLS